MKFGPLSIATVTRLEIYAGTRPNERYDTHKFLSRFIHFDLNRHIAERAGDYIHAAHLAGKQISVPDAIIAATATTHNLTLVTLNVADFRDTPGISLYPLPDWQ
jgi:predicted nucleic acid-binding protein